MKARRRDCQFRPFRRQEATARRAQSTNHIKQLGLAVHNYNSVYGHLPQQAIFGKEGKPLLSWRVALLPYLEQTVLYKKFTGRSHLRS